VDSTERLLDRLTVGARTPSWTHGVWGTARASRWSGARGKRTEGGGARLLAAAERVAHERGCHQIVVSSFTFQAPGFYERRSFVETGRIEGLPIEGAADVQLAKRPH
jgi:GNAT superfamily N-acetyltransferase